jgi:nucleoside-diphosphate-sugar epimerase
MSLPIFLTGATGYVAADLVPNLLARGHRVRALARPYSEKRVPPGARIVLGDPLFGESYRPAVQKGDTFVHLVGTPRPAPWKAPSFQRVDLGSVIEAAHVARSAGVDHFVYVGVAQPAPVMRAYVAARRAAEGVLVASGLRVTVLRPWYVLGPGHRWPHLLRPFYALAEHVPAWSESARRLGLVRREELTAALVRAIEEPREERFRVVDVPAIRAAARDRAGWAVAA